MTSKPSSSKNPSKPQRTCASTIDKLSPELKSALESFLQDPNITQADAAKQLNELAGKVVVSKSAVNRYAVRTRAFRERTLQAQQIAAVWVKELGEDVSNDLGRVLQEQLRMNAVNKISQAIG